MRHLVIPISIISLFFLVLPARAADIIAVSCSQADAQSAIDAASNGDRVMVPTGICTWISEVRVQKEITLQGAGMGLTVIRRNHTGAGIRLTTGAGTGLRYRITGFTMTAVGDTSIGQASTNMVISIEGTGQESNWRVDNMRFDEDPPTGQRKYAIGVSGPTYGVIDHVIFANMGTGLFVQEGISTDPTLFGDASWTRAIDWGGPEAVYMEDSIFVGGGNNNNQTYDGRYGGRIVFRYNSVKDYWIEPHSGCPNRGRAVLHNEIYNNAFQDTLPGGGGTWIACRIRGGTGVIFNNTITDPDNANLILLDNQRSCLTSCLSPWLVCDGTSSGRSDGGSPVDGNTLGFEGWPCVDQIGRGANQVSEPLYAWDNTLNGNPVGIAVFPLGCGRDTSLHILSGRDYFNGTSKPGYAPFVYPHPLSHTDVPSSEYFTLSPCRLIDTRNATATFGGPFLSAGVARTFQAPAGTCGIPTTATALFLNVTVVSPTVAGFLQIYPTGATPPTTSAVNYSANQVRGNNGVFALDATGQFDVRAGQASGTVHVVVDVAGYFVE